MAANGSSHTTLEIFSKFRYVPLYSVSAPLRLRAKSLLCFPFAGIVRHSRASSVIRGSKNPKNPYAKTPTRRITALEIFFKIPLRSALLRLCALLSSVVKNSALFPLSSFKPRSGILRGNPPGSGRSFF